MDISLCLVSVFIVFLLKIIFDNSRYVCDRGETKCQKRAEAKKKKQNFVKKAAPFLIFLLFDSKFKQNTNSFLIFGRMFFFNENLKI